jgi:hypothetical protein
VRDSLAVAATGDRPALGSDEELQEFLALVREADSVELKLTVPEQHRYSSLRALGVDPLDAEIREVYFFDTPDLALDRAGVVARARRRQRGRDDSVIKLRPVDPSKLSPEVRASKNFVVEVDAMPGGFVCSGSYKRELGTTDVKEAAAGQRPVRKLFSKAQRELFAEHAPDGIELDDLALLGPIVVFKLKHTPPELGRKLAVEMWNYPDGSRILELSTRSGIDEPIQVAAETRALLSERGVDLTGTTQTKTRTALDFFSKTLEQESAAA